MAYHCQQPQSCLATPWPCHMIVPSTTVMECQGHLPLNSSSVMLRLGRPTSGYRMRKNLIAHCVGLGLEQPSGEESQVGDHHQTVNGDEAKTVRPLANFPPSLWGDQFASYVLDTELFERYNKEVEVLKEEVKEMLVKDDVGAATTTAVEKMVLIDSLECLGLSYLFENEIDHLLENMFLKFEKYSHVFHDDLFIISTHFRVFRQHGYNLSPSIFQKFKEGDGKFKESISKDMKGMLSLYEATFLKMHGEGEAILDEAFSFTKSQLESLRESHSLSPHLAEQVTHSLNQSLHRGFPRVEARHYISVYENDASMNEMLLRLAKIDFNRLQMLHKEELCQISRWWKGVDLRSDIPYARDRAVELLLCAVSTYFEPQFAVARSIQTKIMILITVVDDTFDSYATYQEIKLFINALLRWGNMDAIDELPKYMKALYTALQNVFDESEEEMAKQERTYGIYYLKESLKELVRSYDVETEWLKTGYVPTLDEYLPNAIVSVTATFMLTASFVGMGGRNLATPEAFQWLQSNPRIVTAYSTIARLVNDICTSEVEQKKKWHVATGVECYMRQHGVSKSEATRELYKRVGNAWKDINEEMVRPNPASKHLLLQVLNHLRMLDVFYKNDDGYTHPVRIKDLVIAVFGDSIPI